MISFQQQVLTCELKKRIDEGFKEYSISTVGFDGRGEQIALIAKEGDVFAGTLVHEIFWGSLHIKFLFIEEPFRNRGLATQLMQQSFAYGLEKGCSYAFVETMSFQASAFYQKMGFELEFTREGFAQDIKLHHMKKDLKALALSN